MDLPAVSVRSNRSRVAVVSALVLLGALAGTAVAGHGEEGADDEPVPVVVGFHDRPAPDLVRRHGGTVTDTFDLIPAVAATVPASAVAALESQPSVAYVDRDPGVRLGETARAHVEEPNQTVPWGVRRIGADAVQANGTNGNGVVVAVLDSGVDADHPDLEGSYAGGVDLVNDAPDPEDDHGHGTYVAGIVAGADDGQGVVGVAPGASIYDVKVLNESLEGNVSDLVAGIEWAIAGRDGEVGTDDDADVIVMSLATFVGTQMLKEAVEAAYEDHGVLVVAAAGNVGDLDYPDTVTFPARYSEVISAGALNRSDERPAWSGAGPRLELSAPGVDVLSTFVGGGRIRGRGTSSAAPYVAGAAALVLDSRIPPSADGDGDGEWNATEVRERLRESAHDLGPEGRDDEFGHGRVDAAAAVGPPRENEPPTVDLLDPAEGEVGGAVTVRASVSDPESIDAMLSVDVTVDGVPVGAAAYNETTGVFELPVAIGALTDGAQGEVSVSATDGAGATASDAVTVDIEGRNAPPNVAVTAPENGSTVDGLVVVRAAASDDRTASSDLRVEYRFDDEPWSPMRHLGDDKFVGGEVESLEPGRHVLVVRTTDEDGESTTSRVVVTVEDT